MSQLEQDVLHAELLLHELALELCQVPVDSHTRELHLRALQLKRDVAAWKSAPAPDAIRRAVVAELGELRGQATAWRGAGGRWSVAAGHASIERLR
jgi:hypothetical protein